MPLGSRTSKLLSGELTEENLMALYQAIGTGPISFLDGNDDQQELPLSAIYVGPTGADATSSPLYSADSGANQALINALLAQMISAGYLAPATTAAAITATAVLAGAMGNSITVTFSDPSAATGTVTVAVTATEVYAGLTPGTIEAALGTTAATAGGLVYVDLAAGPVSGNMPVAVTDAPLSAGAGYDLAVGDVESGTAFTLAATNAADTADAALITVTVTPVSPPLPAVAFDLTVAWTKTTAAPISVATLVGTGTNPFNYLISFSPDGAVGPLPPAGSVTLAGGAAASGTTPAVAASGNILAAS
jgi:hypothetical protein